MTLQVNAGWKDICGPILTQYECFLEVLNMSRFDRKIAGSCFKLAVATLK